MYTHTNWKLNGHLIEVQDCFCTSTVSKLKYKGENSTLHRSMLVKRTKLQLLYARKCHELYIHVTAFSGISITSFDSYSHLINKGLPATGNGTKLLILIMFKNQLVDYAEKSTCDILSEELYGCFQQLRCLGNRSVSVWTKQTRKPYKTEFLKLCYC